MSPGQRQRGQALVEFVLVIPVFVVFLWGVTELALLIRARAQLASITRELSVARARSRFAAESLSTIQSDAMRRARELGLQAQDIEVALGQGLGRSNGPGAALIGRLLTGERMTLRYRYRFGGPLRLTFPEGLVMEESLVYLAGVWKNPGVEILKKIF